MQSSTHSASLRKLLFRLGIIHYVCLLLKAGSFMPTMNEAPKRQGPKTAKRRNMNHLLGVGNGYDQATVRSPAFD